MAKGDLTLLTGKWDIVKAESDGEDWSNPYKWAKFEIAAGGKYTFAMVAVGEESGTITVDSEKNPKEMDLMAATGLAKNQVQEAIYKLEGDELMICFSMIYGRRPTEFQTKPDSWRVLLTYKRKK